MMMWTSSRRSTCASSRSATRVIRDPAMSGINPDRGILESELSNAILFHDQFDFVRWRADPAGVLSANTRIIDTRRNSFHFDLCGVCLACSKVAESWAVTGLDQVNDD